MTNTPQEPLSTEFSARFERAGKAFKRAMGGEKAPAFLLIALDGHDLQMGGNTCPHGSLDLAEAALDALVETCEAVDAEAARLN